MTLIEMERETEDGTVEIGVNVGLQYNEEQQLAEAVMKILSEPSFRGDARDFLEETFWEGRSRGRKLWAEDIDRLMDVFEVWSQRGWFECKMPAFLDGNQNILNDSERADLEDSTSMHNMGDKAGVEDLMILIWKDAWTEYRSELIKLSDSYKEFEGSKQILKRNMIDRPDVHMEKARQAEAEFLAEVARVKTNPTGSGAMYVNWAEEAYVWVLDYQRRGRDVIPQVLMASWLKEETANFHPEEEWVEEARLYSEKELAIHAGNKRAETERMSNPAYRGF